MTFVGKVLVFVQVVLSICFMAFAGAVYNAQTNWKSEAEKLQTQLAQDRNTADAAAKAAKESIRNLTEKLTIAQGEADGNRVKFEAEKDDHEETKAARDAALAAQKQAEDLSAVYLAAAAAEKEEKEAQRSVNKIITQQNLERGREISALKDENFSLKQDAKATERQYNELLGRNRDIQIVLDQLGIDADPKKYKGKNAPPPTVSGIVYNSRKNRASGVEYVEISIGSDDGLDKGHDLFVYREAGRGKYLGKIRVIFVTPDRAVGQLIERAKNSQIEKGDNVSTKL